MARNYKEEYKDFHSKPDEKKRRAGRNAARKKMAAAGKVKKGDGKGRSSQRTATPSSTTSVKNLRVSLSQKRTELERNEP